MSGLTAFQAGPRNQIMRLAKVSLSHRRSAQLRLLRQPHSDRASQLRPQIRCFSAAPRTNAQDGLDYRSESSKAQQNTTNPLALELHKQAKAHGDDFLAPVHIPRDSDAILDPCHPASAILANSSIIVQRQLELMNVLLSYEQANRYVILDPLGNHIGFVAELDGGLGKSLMRNVVTTHRKFTTLIFDKYEKEVLRIHRPFSYINSRISVYDPLSESANPSLREHHDVRAMKIIGEARQVWAPMRRKYDLYVERDSENTHVGDKVMSQFAHIDEQFLSWDFSLRDRDGSLLGSVNRSWGGLGREMFTDTGAYTLRMDDAMATQEPRQGGNGPEIARGKATDIRKKAATSLLLDKRAVMLATAISIDFDYFSRHSHSGAGMMPLWIPMAGGGGEAGAVGAEAGSAAATIGGSEVLGAGTGAAGRGAGVLAGEEAIGAAGIAGAAGVGVANGTTGDFVPEPPTDQDSWKPSSNTDPVPSFGQRGGNPVGQEDKGDADGDSLIDQAELPDGADEGGGGLMDIISDIFGGDG